MAPLPLSGPVAVLASATAQDQARMTAATSSAPPPERGALRPGRPRRARRRRVAAREPAGPRGADVSPRRRSWRWTTAPPTAPTTSSSKPSATAGSIRNPEPLGVARAFDVRPSQGVSAEADFLLLLHDDAALDPEVVDPPRRGHAAPRGRSRRHRRSQGRRRETRGSSGTWVAPPIASVIRTPRCSRGRSIRGSSIACSRSCACTSCAMLVARDVWRAGGLFDERSGRRTATSTCAGAPGSPGGVY